MLIPNSQIQGLTKKFTRLCEKTRINFSLITNADLPNKRSYFSSSLVADFASLENIEFKFHSYQSVDNLEDVDVIILTAHGGDHSNFILELKNKYPHLIFATWFFDNHLAHISNYKTAIVSDIYYPSHAYCKDYLMNPYSPFGLHLPSCTAQWAKYELDFKKTLMRRDRESKIFLNYVDYKFSWRTEILAQIRKFLPEAHVQTMLPENRDRYFTLSPAEKYQEWCSYKSTLILPVDKDLSTRVFDALFAGQILIVPTLIEDFDSVISKEWQNELGIIRIQDLNLSTIQFAAQKAFEIFDKRGVKGLSKRFEFASEKHMFKNRIETILKNIQLLSSTSKSIKFGSISGSPGLYVE
jgi:hypothetical protein